jgi:hypothetical protein
MHKESSRETIGRELQFYMLLMYFSSLISLFLSGLSSVSCVSIICVYPTRRWNLLFIHKFSSFNFVYAQTKLRKTDQGIWQQQEVYY